MPLVIYYHSILQPNLLNNHEIRGVHSFFVVCRDNEGPIVDLYRFVLHLTLEFDCHGSNWCSSYLLSSRYSLTNGLQTVKRR